MIPAPTATSFSHLALLFNTEEDFTDATVPFLREGVEQGDAVVVVSAPHRLSAVRSELSQAESDAITMEDSEPRYRRAAHALTSWCRLLRELTGRGRRVRIVGEPPFDKMAPEQALELCQGDAAFNEVARVPGATVLCPVDLRTTPPKYVAMFRRSHPELVENGQTGPNPAYTGPAALIAELRRHTPMPEPATESPQLHCPADPAQARRFIQETAACFGLDAARVRDFVTAVNEVVANAFRHAVIDGLRCWREPGRIVCEVRDYGLGFADALAGYREPDHDATSGWGLWLARQLTDLVEVRTGPEGTCVRLHLELGEPPAPPTGP